MTVPLLHLSTPAIYFKGEGSPRQRKIEKKIAKKKRLYIRIYNFYHSYNNPTAIKQYINEGLYMMEIFLINNLTQKISTDIYSFHKYGPIVLKLQLRLPNTIILGRNYQNFIVLIIEIFQTQTVLEIQKIKKITENSIFFTNTEFVVPEYRYSIRNLYANLYVFWLRF